MSIQYNYCILILLFLSLTRAGGFLMPLNRSHSMAMFRSSGFNMVESVPFWQHMAKGCARQVWICLVGSPSNLLRPLHTTPPPSKPHVWLLEMKLQTRKAKGNFLPLYLPCSRTAVLRDCNLIRVLKRCQMRGIVWSWRPPGPRAIFERAAVWDSSISWKMLSLPSPRVRNWSRKTRIGAKRWRGPRSCCSLNRHIRRRQGDIHRFDYNSSFLVRSFVIQPASNGSRQHIFGPQLLKV